MYALRSDVGSVVELSAAAGAVWVGVDLDEPAGKHGGSVLGRQYFTARGAKHGTFVKPANVTCGDYPEIDPFDESDDDDEEQQTRTDTQRSETQSNHNNNEQQSGHTQSGSVSVDNSAPASAIYEEL